MDNILHLVMHATLSFLGNVACIATMHHHQAWFSSVYGIWPLFVQV